MRVNPSLHLSGEGSDGAMYGLYFADAGQHPEQRVYLHHQAANTKGRVKLQGCAPGHRRPHGVGRRRAHRPRGIRNRFLRAEPQPRALWRAPARIRSRTWRSRPGTSSVPATPARPGGSTTSSSSTCGKPAESPEAEARRLVDASPRSCRRSAIPHSGVPAGQIESELSGAGS